MGSEMCIRDRIIIYYYNYDISVNHIPSSNQNIRSKTNYETIYITTYPDVKLKRITDQALTVILSLFPNIEICSPTDWCTAFLGVLLV